MEEYSQHNRVHVLPDGSIILKDPDERVCGFLDTMGLSFSIESFPPPKGFISSLNRNRDCVEDKARQSLEMLGSCELCGWRCGVDRFKRAGRCGLREKAYCALPFVHVAEESVFNPAWNVKLYGCGWRCLYCQSPEMLSPYNALTYGERVNEALWARLVSKGPGVEPVSLEMIGGNPTESVAGIISSFFVHAPADFNLPVVWNDNLYGTPQAYQLLEGIVDVYVPDLRYGNGDCAKRLSGVPDYWETVTSAMEAIAGQDARIIVRILVLPGHAECCHIPALEWLSRFRNRVWVSLLDQYVPEHEVLGDPEMDKLPSGHEVAWVRSLISGLGLREVNDNPEGFWE